MENDLRYNKYTDDRAQAKALLARKDEFIDRGKRIIYKEQYDRWEKFVKRHLIPTDKVNDINFCGGMVANVLEIMEAIEESKSYDNIREIIKEQGHSGTSFEFLIWDIVPVSKKGVEFYYNIRGNRADGDKEWLEQIAAGDAYCKYVSNYAAPAPIK